jgi:CRISPR-associated protein Cas2
VKAMLVLISYEVNTQDPAGKKRLRKIAKHCENWGQRVQFSVFECLVDPAQWAALRSNLTECMDVEKDSLRFYYLGANWKNRVEHVGAKKSYDPQGPLIL